MGAALKGGQVAAHQQILIDGQQRVTALRAAVAGLPVVDKRYRKARITIAFNPVIEAFETTTPVLRKNPEWIADISEFFTAASSYTFMREYFDAVRLVLAKDVDEPRSDRKGKQVLDLDIMTVTYRWPHGEAEEALLRLPVEAPELGRGSTAVVVVIEKSDDGGRVAASASRA